MSLKLNKGVANGVAGEVQRVLNNPETSEDEHKARIQAIEARRLLAHLDHANIRDTVCEESLESIRGLLCRKPWQYCKKPSQVAEFLHEDSKKWARQGYRIVIEGGSERVRRRVMNYCIYRAILANFDCCTFVARIYDWSQVMSSMSSYSDPRRNEVIGGMEKIKVLGLGEINLSSPPRQNNDSDVVLTGVLRGRMIDEMPTIITLTNSSMSGDTASMGTEINNIVNTPHDEEIEMVLRIKVAGANDEE